MYLIVVDGEIKKIGGSQAEGGIKQTLEIYRDGGVKGRPSIRSYGIWYFLYYTILEGKKIEFYMIYEENFAKDIKGLFGLKRVENAYISYKLIEQNCIDDYLAFSVGTHPEWNIQEQGKDYPLEIKTQHAKIQTNAQIRAKKISRKEAQR